MTWLQYLSFLAAITGVRWALNEMTPHGDDYLFGGMIIGCLAWIIYQRFRAHALLDLWFRSSDAIVRLSARRSWTRLACARGYRYRSTRRID